MEMAEFVTFTMDSNNLVFSIIFSIPFIVSAERNSLKMAELNAFAIDSNSSASNITVEVPNTCTANATSNCSAAPFTSGVSDSVAKVTVGEAYLSLVGYTFIALVGVVRNIFVLGVVALCKDMRTVANYFITSLSVSDLLVSVIIVPINAAARWLRVWTLGEAMCDLVAIINHTSMAASVFNLAAIAVNRVIITRHPGRFQDLFSRPRCAIYIAIIWFFALLYGLLPVFGWGGFEFDKECFLCIYSREAAPSYSIFFSTVCVLLPQVVCGICYLMILVTFIRSRSALERLPEVTLSGISATSERKLTKNLLVVWVAFVLCWLPSQILLCLDPEGDLDEGFYTFALWMVFLNSCINPIIYGVFNRKFRLGYLRLINTSLLKNCRKHQVCPAQPLPASLSSRPTQRNLTPLRINVSSRSNEVNSMPQLPDRPLNTGVTLLEIPHQVKVRGRFIEVEC